MNAGREPFWRNTPLIYMRTSIQTVAAFLAISGCLLMATALRAADFELSAEEHERLSRGETVIRASLDAAQRSGTVRAAMLVDAPPEVVFQAMTRCADALKYMPHLRTCR